MNKIKVLFLIDWPKDEDFILWKTMPGDKIDFDVIGMKFPKGTSSPLMKSLLIWPRYILVGILGFLKRKDYDIVVAWQQVEGLVFGFLKHLFNARSPRLLIMGLMYLKRSTKISESLRFRFTKYALSSVDYIGCSNSRVIEKYANLFSFNINKFGFIPSLLGIDRNPYFSTEQEGDYVFSAGRSNRDYKTLFSAIKGLDMKLVVVAQPDNLKGLPIPPNVETYYNVFGEKYLELLKKSRLIVIPLNDVEISAGQIVLWQSLSMGKAVIITESWAVMDYVEDNKDVVFVKPHESDELGEAIKDLMSNPEKRRQLGENAVNSLKTRFSWESFSNDLTLKIVNVCQGMCVDIEHKESKVSKNI